ncbi:hypothetical protein FE394_12735 [Xenorhabdus sp. Reich]|uniref:Uncharacterized protein n=1 Tax=Xenorhabdus littoralis TaxID=2582835 RepID=A0ABU4SN14_9GAMM|nr:hypothetical protein [Xenorhabdus sp. Reich]MDX8000046.1 hypothetical protein [Xenorhabdus sp. Reich]
MNELDKAVIPNIFWDDLIYIANGFSEMSQAIFNALKYSGHISDEVVTRINKSIQDGFDGLIKTLNDQKSDSNS